MVKAIRKLIVFVLVAMLIIFAIRTEVYASNNVRLVIGGENVYSDVSPYIKDNRTMVPLRVIAENLGAEV